MTTAHRPTFDPVLTESPSTSPTPKPPILTSPHIKARGKEALRGPAYHTRMLPAHTALKFRKAGQGGSADAEDEVSQTDLAAELLAAEAIHFKKKNGGGAIAEHHHHHDDEDDHMTNSDAGVKRPHQIGSAEGGEQEGEVEEESLGAKRRRILAEFREIDADDTDSEAGDDDDGSSDDSDDDDDDAELQRELARVRREREEKKKKEEEERAKAEEEAKERDIALGNPLLNKQDFTIKRRWDDDVVFKNQARGTEDKGKKEFVNDMIRSDFHRRFMSKYVR